MKRMVVHEGKVNAESEAYVSALIAAALEEDIGSGDLSGEWFVPGDLHSCARMVARQPGCLAGVEIAARVFSTVDERINISRIRADGDFLREGDRIIELEGPTRSLLAAERTALNFVQQLSGVASLTRRFVEAVAGTRAKILDTRKTLPGWRMLQKHAVRIGGGTNHRMGLYDMVMLKDNHLAALGGNLQSIQRALDEFHAAHPDIRVEIEADTVGQVRDFLGLRGVHVILLDNMKPAELCECVQLRDAIAPQVLLEASGGVNLQTVREIALTGVDFISCGALTHSAPALDIALDFY